MLHFIHKNKEEKTKSIIIRFLMFKLVRKHHGAGERKRALKSEVCVLSQSLPSIINSDVIGTGVMVDVCAKLFTKLV